MSDTGDATRPPASFNFALDVVEARAREAPGARALIAVDANGQAQYWTYGDVASAVRRLGAALAGCGLARGERVLILLPRIPAWHIAMAACMRLGWIPVPCVSQLTAAEVAYRARCSGARGAVTSRACVGKFSAIESDLRLKLAVGGAPGWLDFDRAMGAAGNAPPGVAMPASAPALMYFTSGSSGNPKAVLHAARGVYVRCRQPWRQLGLGPGDIVWTTSDTGWTRAASCLLFGAWTHGATAFMHDGPADPAVRIELMARHGITVFCAVATELRMLLREASLKRDFLRLRFTLSAGEAVTAELIEQWRACTGAPIVVGYGQTETPTATLTAPEVAPANGMIGRPMAGNRVTVIDEHGRETQPGVQGDIAFAADDPGIMLGYWCDGRMEPGRTRAGPHCTWYLSGDCGYRDANGDLYFVGREDDIISSAGYRIGPTEVEDALMQHPAVLECAVAASPDELRGDVVKAFVVLRPGVEPGAPLVSALQDHVKRLIAPYKYPRRVAFVRNLPRTASGKLLRRLLREAEWKAT